MWGFGVKFKAYVSLGSSVTGTVWSRSGLTFRCASFLKPPTPVDYLINDIEVNDFDALAIPGGFEDYGLYNDAYHDTFLDLIRRFRQQNKIIASICIGALPLGKSGILTGKTGTTYSSPARPEALKGFGVNVLHQPIVMDDNVITSWNPYTAIHVALLLLENLTSKNNSDNVRKLMGF